MVTIYDPLLLSRLVQRFSLRDQPPAELGMTVIPVVDVGPLLSTSPGSGSPPKRLQMGFAGESNALTNATFGSSVHYPVQTAMVVRGMQLDVTMVDVQAPTAAGIVALNAYLFIVRQVVPTYSAGNFGVTNLASQSGAGLPLGAATVSGGAIVSRVDAAEIYLPVSTEVFLAAAGAIPTGGLRVSASLYDYAIPLNPALGGSANPDFFGVHVDLASTATFPAGTIVDIVYKASLIVDLLPAT